MKEISFNMAQTLAIAAILLYVGNVIKKHSSLLQRFFIPAPVVSGLICSLFVFVGRQSNLFEIKFDLTLQNFLMIAFFTTVGFMASLKLLAQGGIGVVVFLAAATGLVIFQDIIGVTLAKVLGQHPLFGLLVGSVPLTGGHGTAGAFGTDIGLIIGNAIGGEDGARTVGFAAATYGLVMGCLIGGPVGRLLMKKHNLKGEDNKAEDLAMEKEKEEGITEEKILTAVILIALAMGIGSYLPDLIHKFSLWISEIAVKKGIFKEVGKGLKLPAYIGPMLIAALFRNLGESTFKKPLPMKEIDSVGSIALSLFLSMALMTLQLYQLLALAGPMLIILAVQTIFVILYTYFVTYNIMNKIVSKYDATVIVTGHCGFGMGATPTAIANMEAFTSVNGFSTKAFFIVPLVGALFIDFTNAAVITFFMSMYS
ncbi:sodium/glutamate symporter [Fusobacterium sp. PH5-44]|uniref:sodium/glutamate symporter n=1 Tax=unclassified Fusobacterium TaxID=2648384 RepID=UPI003D1D89A1